LNIAQSKLGFENCSIGFQSKKEDTNIMMTYKFSRCFALKVNVKKKLFLFITMQDAKSKKQSANNKCEL